VYPFRKILACLFLVAVFMGCAMAPVMETPKEALQSQEARFVRDSIARGKEFEAAGNLPEALRQYKIALTVRPNDGTARDGRERVEKASRKGAEDHYKAGLRLQKEGKQAQAMRRYLTALRLWPDYPEALQQMALVRTPVPVEWQVVQKVPAEPDVKEPPQEAIVEEEAPAPPEEPPAQVEPAVDQVAVYREYGMELYWEGRYQEALSEFSKVLGVRPEDPVAKEYSYKSSFELAVEFFQKKEYLAAREQFLISLKHNSKCQHCHFYIRRSEELFKEMHYKQGIEYYGKEQLADAIVEWELVRGLDPNYKRVDYYIKKAKDLERKIDELRRELTEEGQEQ
jgi:tetratricopeptide (TPR) repeat protein